MSNNQIIYEGKSLHISDVIMTNPQYPFRRIILEWGDQYKTQREILFQKEEIMNNLNQFKTGEMVRCEMNIGGNQFTDKKTNLPRAFNKDVCWKIYHQTSSPAMVEPQTSSDSAPF